MSVVIKAENISKQYRLGEVGTGTLSHDLNRIWYRIRGKEDPYLKIGEVNDRTQKGSTEYVWALKNASFEVKQGEVLGIIGRNGAGKSTLLKILSRTTAPTTGSVKAKGRIASLLEVGTGFHPELTGKENIYLNGAILGMRKKEIERKLDEIVFFAGVERYIDTPVKRYSSGMYVRLAFGVAAHLESEILIVDEVLAVGDAEFQKKCLGKMKDVSTSEGRTVLFVSHNMPAVKSLCTHGIILANGIVTYDGDVNTAISKYLTGSQNELPNSKKFDDIFEEGVFRLEQLEVRSSGYTVGESIVEDHTIELITKVTILSSNPQRYHITFHLHNEMGDPLFSFSHMQTTGLKQGTNELVCTFPARFFQSGSYYLSFFFVEDKRTAIYVEKDILMFNIVDAEREIGVYMGKEPGYVRPEFNWENKNS